MQLKSTYKCEEYYDFLFSIVTKHEIKISHNTWPISKIAHMQDLHLAAHDPRSKILQGLHFVRL